MNPQDHPDNPFAPEYAHVHEWVTAAEARLQALDQEMHRTGVAPRLEYRPPDPTGRIYPVPEFRRSRDHIQRDKDETKAGVYRRVEKETEAAEPRLKKETQDIAFGRLYKEDIEKLRAADLGLASPTASWSMDEAQVKALLWMKEHRDEHRPDPGQGQSRERAAVRAPDREQPDAPPEWEPER